MLSKFEEAAVFLKRYRVMLILVSVFVLVGGFVFANGFGQETARMIRKTAMTLTWWLWLLFLMPAWFAPQNNSTDTEGSMSPRLSEAMRVFLMALMIFGFVSPIVVPLILGLYY